MIDHVVVTPVKVHAQPAPDRQAKAKGDERRGARSGFFDVYNRRVILRDIHILRLSWNNPDIVSFDNDALFSVTDQIADGPRPPPEPLDRIGHVLRLVEKGISQVGGPIHILGHHLKNARVVGNCPDGLSPNLLVNT
jgi:hypothetical protein